jgi:DNA polymerase-4
LRNGGYLAPKVLILFQLCYGAGMLDSKPRKIIHVDMDAFYASVEQRDDPGLKSRPVAVGYGAKRGVVAAASYEARAYGVRSAMPSVTAMRQCPDLIFVRPRFDVYRAVSRQIHAIFADYTALIEPLSLDEAYLDVSENMRGLTTAWATARDIRRRILAETGLTASAGISYNKFLAKLASSRNKPNGQFAITPELGPAFVETLPVAKFHGIGPATAAKMHRLGIMTGADLRAKPFAFLQQHFGKAAAWYQGVAQGQDHRPVLADRVRKSSGSETTFGHDLTEEADIEAGVQAMADEVWAWCAKAQAFGRTVTVKIKFADFRQVTRSRSFAGAVTSQDRLRQASLDLVRSLFPPPLGIRLAGVTVSNFDGPCEEKDLPLFGAAVQG